MLGEQRHHLGGAVGRGLYDRLTELDWVRPTRTSRAVHVSDSGRSGLADASGVRLDE